MDYSSQIQAIARKIEDLIAGEPDLFLVEIKIKPTNNVKVFIDGDQEFQLKGLLNITEVCINKLKKVACFPMAIIRWKYLRRGWMSH
jgi:ribosome maturation factor RimP